MGAIAVAFVVASCATRFIGEPPTKPQLDDHCILHVVAELDDGSDRLISQARNAGEMIAIERWAIAEGRWRYREAMPTIAGIGLTPLLQ